MNEEKILHEYRERGWCVVEGIYDPAECEAVAALALQYSQEEEKSESYLQDRDDHGNAQPRKLDSPFRKDKQFRNFAMNENLIRWCRALLGEKPLLATDQIFLKPPEFGSAKPYHQDNFYFQCEPEDLVLTAWIALDDVDKENGCLRYINASHRGPILEHVEVPGEPYNLAPPSELIDLSKESLAPVKKGGVVFHNGKTLHTSHRNESKRWRRAYATHWLTPSVNINNESLDKSVYFKSDLYNEY